MTLYEQNPAAWDKIAASGAPNLAIMARYFLKPSEMDAALGYTKAVGNWVRRGGSFRSCTDKTAQLWLASNVKVAAPAPKPAAASGVMLLIVCPDGIAPKIERIAAMMGCEVTDI